MLDVFPLQMRDRDDRRAVGRRIIDDREVLVQFHPTIHRTSSQVFVGGSWVLYTHLHLVVVSKGSNVG